jgi:predicted DNA-binding protein with PD1-like motif
VPLGVDLKTGRTLSVTFRHGEDFFAGLIELCRQHDIRYGYIPMFIGGFRWAGIAGTCDKVADPEAPVWSGVHLTTLDAVGSGTIAWDEAAGQIFPHVHLSVGIRPYSATGHTGHLVDAEVQYLTEMLLVEVEAPAMRRVPDHDLYDIPMLTLG